MGDDKDIVEIEMLLKNMKWSSEISNIDKAIQTIIDKARKDEQYKKKLLSNLNKLPPRKDTGGGKRKYKKRKSKSKQSRKSKSKQSRKSKKRKSRKRSKTRRR